MARRLKVVVADDEVETREYLSEYLARLGHEVRAAVGGRQLVELCGQFAPDLIVTDYAMPGMTGLEAAAVVGRQRPVPVIVISGRHDAESLAAVEGVVVTFLMKPVKEADLKAAVEAVAACPAGTAGP